MHKFNYLCSVILVITLPVMILILTSNFVLRTSVTYSFHFNDSQIVDEIPFNVTESDIADGISSFLSPFNNKEFQVYEDNGIYKDPVFEKDEQKLMRNYKKTLNIFLSAGVAALVLCLATYIYLLKNGYHEALRNRFRVGAGISLVLIVARIICWMSKGFRNFMYDRFIGITLSKDTTICMLIGDPFYKTCVLFMTIFGIALVAVLIYLNHCLTKPDRIFY